MRAGGSAVAVVLDGKEAAGAWRAELKERAAALAARTGVWPGLAMVWVGDDPASGVYVRTKDRAAAEAGIRTRVVRLEAAAGAARLGEAIDRLAADPSVDGILVQLPLPAGYEAGAALERIPPAKDADGLTAASQGLLALGRPRFVPATPLGILELLRRHAIPLAGVRAAVIGRSAIVGRPLAILLGSRPPVGVDATVTVCHSHTAELAAITREADLLVAAAGRPGLVTAAMVKPGATVIDVGIHRVARPGGGEHLVGDVDFAGVSPIAGAITPVPGGVGPMTVAALLHNTIAAAEGARGAQRW